jgi:hypothetical protein
MPWLRACRLCGKHLAGVRRPTCRTCRNRASCRRQYWRNRERYCAYQRARYLANKDKNHGSSTP